MNTKLFLNLKYRQCCEILEGINLYQLFRDK